MNTDEYFKMPAELMRCSGFVSKKTGELIPITHTAKLVLTYMINRNRFFAEVMAGDHYETQVTIGDACGLEYKAAARSLKVFVDHGVILAEKVRNTKISPHKCFYYRGVDTSVELYSSVTPRKPRVAAEEKPAVPVKVVVPGAVDDFTDEFIDNL